ncbi:MAG: fibrobacter succinogenes major paralogous domain-containing protein, partial [Flavobacteriaceae bacterium]|nr:fibrobacter succinogenes major paralogous domain-containing protein [Flavobacteriaceae bacterium]
TLFLPVAGMRHRDDGNITDVGIRGYYWSSTVSESYSYNVHISDSGALPDMANRTFGFSVRCVKEH